MTLKLFILSDLHAFDGSLPGDRRPSYYDISQTRAGSPDNPLLDLAKLIDEHKMTCDYLVCCGDLGDQAQPKAIEAAWNQVQDLAVKLKVRGIVATVGNHDVDSRHKHNDHDATGVLLELQPTFPFSDEKSNTQFWTHHFASFVDSESGARFAVLNSCAYHGAGEGEHTHGRVSERTIKRLKTFLDKQSKVALNVLVCHHHPQKHSELKLGDYDDMTGGYDLISLLDCSKYGPWIIFHGHKHHPKICYAQGSSCSPVVFSAGSCAAILQPELQGHARNQVYLVEIEIPQAELKAVCQGRFSAWDWSPGNGWSEADSKSGIPANGGFGWRRDLGEIATRINKFFPKGARWDKVLNRCPEVRYLLPIDVIQLCDLLRASFHYKIERGSNGNPFILEK